MALTKRERDKVIVRFYNEQTSYERLAHEIRRLIDEESPYLAGALYTVKHRLKDKDRLLQKIDQRNQKLGKRGKPIDRLNFQDRIDDLLGIRIVCLRLSDLDKLKRYLSDLEDDRKIKILKGPTEKKTFLVTPGGPDSRDDIQYSGYSSIHYVIRLDKNSSPAPQLAGLKAEIQLRTILEEAWGELDHKYRYELKRSGAAVPAHVDSGFRDLALYLQAAARHVEHLCEDIERLKAAPKPVRKRAAPRPRPVEQESAPLEVTTNLVQPPIERQPLSELFRKLLGFEPTMRTIAYVRQRITEHSGFLGRPFTDEHLEHALSEQLRRRFEDIYQEMMGKAPFVTLSESDRDLDVIPLVNFALFSTTQSQEVAEAGLRASLRRRLQQYAR